ncbi:MAG: DNA replication/repair protein RecF [Fusobacteriota bacterium]
MQINTSTFLNFRNLKKDKLKFEPNLNIFYGQNGQGKTNLLEMLYFNITGKSFRTNKVKELINHEKDRLKVFSNYSDMIGNKNIAVSINNKKEYYYNKTKVKYDEFIGKVNAISFIPEDISLVIGSPSIRRNFFDYEISQANFKYYQNLKEYNKILKSRNKLLKTKNTRGDIFVLYNEKFIDYSIKILKKRLDFSKNLSRLLNLKYRKLFDLESELKLKYISFIGEIEKLSENQIREKILKKMEKVKKRENRYGYSLVGPQKDKYKFLLNEKNARHYSSQGEKKSIVFALKIAEIDIMIKEKKEYPIFLIDDISSYLDFKRKNNIIEYFKNKKIQTFITSTEKVDLEGNNFYIEKGRIYAKNS